MAKLSGIKRFFGKVGRRNWIILSAVLLIGAAVYLNYLWFYDPADAIGYGDNNAVDAGTEVNGGANAGDADYFTAAQLSRKQTRDEAIEVLQTVARNTEEDSAEHVSALSGISDIAVNMEREANIESLVEAKGFSPCVAVVNGDRASVVVSHDAELTGADNARICTIVYEQTGILPQNVTIIRK
ncbi:MAG: SpoIIIAH-like family protein [Clostridia bacterium]|nr:SpoIIIAH-like family protein [Clostridia bacterium]